MIAKRFHAWERRLASIDTNRIVRPFEWGLDWLDLEPGDDRPGSRLSAWSRETTVTSDRFFDAPPTSD